MFALTRKQQVTPKHQFTYRHIADVSNLRDHCHENVKWLNFISWMELNSGRP